MSAIDEFIASLKSINWLHPDGQPDPAWKLFIATTWAAARDAALAATRAMVWDVVGDEACAAAGTAAWIMACDVIVQDAAWIAARDAIWTAAENTAWEAARTVVLMAACLIAGDKIAPQHLTHARARMDVWRKGYGLLRDVDGVLYVYGVAP